MSEDDEWNETTFVTMRSFDHAVETTTDDSRQVWNLHFRAKEKERHYVNMETTIRSRPNTILSLKMMNKTAHGETTHDTNNQAVVMHARANKQRTIDRPRAAVK